MEFSKNEKIALCVALSVATEHETLVIEKLASAPRGAINNEALATRQKLLKSYARIREKLASEAPPEDVAPSD